MSRQFLVLIFVVCCSVAQWEGVLAKEAPRKPNVVILFIDDLGYGDLACFGNKRIPTPHIDSLATQWCSVHHVIHHEPTMFAKSVRFDDGYVRSTVRKIWDGTGVTHTG